MSWPLAEALGVYIKDNPSQLGADLQKPCIPAEPKYRHLVMKTTHGYTNDKEFTHESHSLSANP